jgi:hypothetical protein
MLAEDSEPERARARKEIRKERRMKDSARKKDTTDLVESNLTCRERIKVDDTMRLYSMTTKS